MMSNPDAGETESSCVYGPVPSWRLGQSLGIDPVPHKTCNWNCVYCQLGRTRPVVCNRDNHIPTSEVMAALQRFFEHHSREDVDWLTFVGSGEPLLHAGIGEMIRSARESIGLPVAVITNGSLLYRPEVRKELSAAQAVLPSLDAGTPELYRKLNRPHPEFSFERHITGLEAFRQGYQGWLWAEVMLVDGMNDSGSALVDLAAVLGLVRPDEIHINFPTRPPAEPWVKAPDQASIMRAAALFEEVAPVRIASATGGYFDLSGVDSVIDSIISIIKRHPMSQDELEQTLTRWAPGQVETVLDQLANSSRVRMTVQSGRRFWQRPLSSTR